MIFADTSVWIDYLDRADSPSREGLATALDTGQVVGHPLLTIELSLGSLPKRGRARLLDDLDALPSLSVASHEEVRTLIETRELWSRGIGYVDTAFLAGLLLTGECDLWTRDRKLAKAAEYLDIRTERLP